MNGLTFATIDLTEAEYKILLCRLRQQRAVAAADVPARPDHVPARGV